MLKKSGLVLLLVVVAGLLPAANPNPDQTRRQHWEQVARDDIAKLFQTVLDTTGELRRTADFDGAVKILKYYKDQEPVKEEKGEVVVEKPLKEFLSAPYGNYPGGMSNERPLQGIFYERAREKRAGQRQDNLDKIAEYYIAMTAPAFFTAPATIYLNEKITGSDPKMIPYLLFALRYGMANVAKKLLQSNPSLAQAKIDSRSAYSYAFEGNITDKDLITSLGAGLSGAIIQEADFDYFSDPAKKAEFLAWLIEHGVLLKNVAVSKIAGLKKSAEGLAAERALRKFTQSLYGLAQD